MNQPNPRSVTVMSQFDRLPRIVRDAINESHACNTLDIASIAADINSNKVTADQAAANIKAIPKPELPFFA